MLDTRSAPRVARGIAAAAAVSTEVATAQTTIATLTRSSAEINDIIAMIDAVAAQTRLLAPNATSRRRAPRKRARGSPSSPPRCRTWPTRPVGPPSG